MVLHSRWHYISMERNLLWVHLGRSKNCASQFLNGLQKQTELYAEWKLKDAEKEGRFSRVISDKSMTTAQRRDEVTTNFVHGTKSFKCQWKKDSCWWFPNILLPSTWNRQQWNPIPSALSTSISFGISLVVYSRHWTVCAAWRLTRLQLIRCCIQLTCYCGFRGLLSLYEPSTEWLFIKFVWMT